MGRHLIVTVTTQKTTLVGKTFHIWYSAQFQQYRRNLLDLLPTYIHVTEFNNIGHVNEYPSMRCFGIPAHSVNDSIYDFDWVFVEIPVKCCIVGMTLTRPIKWFTVIMTTHYTNLLFAFIVTGRNDKHLSLPHFTPLLSSVWLGFTSPSSAHPCTRSAAGSPCRVVIRVILYSYFTTVLSGGHRLCRSLDWFGRWLGVCDRKSLCDIKQNPSLRVNSIWKNKLFRQRWTWQAHLDAMENHKTSTMIV